MTQRYIGGLIYNPPGGYSGYFNGSSSLSISSSNTVLPTGTQDFCVEMWFSWQTQSGSYPQLIANPTTNGFQIYYDVSGGLLAVGIFNVSNVITYTISQTALSGAWNHLAVTRSGNTFRLFINGVLQANGTNSISFASVTTQYIGSDGSRPYTGYLSNVRTVLGAIPTPYQTSSTTNGTAVFTPPNGALQAITSTALLTCAYSTFRDGSSNAFTITVNGAVVSTQNPFPLTTLPNPAQGNAGNGIFSMSQYQSLKQQNLWPGFDPYFENTTLLLHGNGTNGAQNNTFLDSSTNNFTITRNGNTTQGTFTPYGSNWSNYLTGSSYLTWSGSSIGTSVFTFECWFYYTGTSFPPSGQDGASFIGPSSASSSALNLNIVNSTTVSFDRYGVSADNFTVSTLVANTWYHIAFVRDSSNRTTVFLNGVRSSTGTVTSSYNYSGTTNAVGFTGGAVARYFPGYISNARLVIGSAVYDPTQTSVTIPTAPLTAITNTSLLTCQSNRFIDNSTNAYALTVTGTPSVQRFSPFSPSAAYAAGTIGGSGYFDGSGDSLQTPSNAAFTFGTGDFTLECWAYLSGNYPGVVSGIVDISTSNSTGRLVLDLYSTGYVNIETVGVSLVASNTLLPKNAWSHLVAVRSGTTLSLFQNGTRVGTATNSTNFSFSQAYVGVTSDGYYWSGYLSSVRLVKGTAVYDPSQSTLTVPTAPLTAITNTSLLLNMTNGGIIDNAMMNDLETVGNAQISTTQSKFGGASMYFDGTGDYLSAPASQNAAFGTGNFTIECWLYKNASTAYMTLCGNFQIASENTFQILGDSTGTKIGWYNGATNSFTVTGATTLNTNTWYHIAFVRSGTTLTLYVNGTSDGSASLTTDYNNTTRLFFVGQTPELSSGRDWNGYIDDLRITKGVARYTANFTPQTSQWQDQ
jgi:hypothetical protein